MPWTKRLLDGAELDPSTGCLNWQRARNNRGYGVIHIDGKLRLAHRAAWRYVHGEWPAEGKVLDHLCNNKACVNTDHLVETENHLNLRRAIPRGDEATERKRAGWRRSNAKRRGTYRYTEGGE